MIYTPKEYSRAFKLGRKTVSAKTVIRRARSGQLPCKHIARQIPGRRGQWIIEVRDK